MSYFQYLADHPESAATFNAAMTGWSAQVASAVVEAYDFSHSGTVADAGWPRELRPTRICAASCLTRLMYRHCHAVSDDGWRR
jgi:hypothetical protein